MYGLDGVDGDLMELLNLFYLVKYYFIIFINQRRYFTIENIYK
jgi:hypothetical protein